MKIIFLFIFLLFIAACSNENYIKEEIDFANYCDIDSDCVDVGGKCPFDCYILVNEDKADYIKGLVDGFDSRCAYSCIQTFGAVCVDNKCESVLEPVACSEEAKLCEDGSFVTRNISLYCDFNPCQELKRNYCSNKSRTADFCIEIYQPVCGWNGPQIQCIRYPCASTFSNSCRACQNENVDYWTSGVCQG